MLEQNAPFIRIVIEVDEKIADIRIEDNGHGIQEAHLTRVFDMFYRASKNIEGSGLGLYIVKNFVENLGGQITVASKFQEGTEFILVIPNRQL